MIFKKLLSSIISDGYLFGMILFLIIVSLLSVYSTSSVVSFSKTGDTTSMLFEHMQKVSLSIAVLVIVSCFSISKLKFLIPLIYGISFILLGIVLFMGDHLDGTTINGSKRWITLLGFQFQPSELMKIALVLMLAKQLSDVKKNYLYIGALFACPIFLIGLENGSTAMLIATCGLFMLIIGNYPMRLILIGLGCIVALFLILLMFDLLPRVDTWTGRISRFFEGGGEDIQSEYAKTAIATSDIMGVGLGQSAMKSFLPISYADFIFAVIVEETGIVGIVTLLAVYCGIFFRARVHAVRCEMKFDAYVLIGIAFMYTLQAFVHIFVNIGIFPVTGQTLPFISWGGSSSLFVAMGYGIMLSIIRDINKNQKANINQHTD